VDWPALVARAGVTGFPLLGIVYYGGGALTDVDQSFGRASIAGLVALFGAFPLYDVTWRLLRRHGAAAVLVSLALFTSVAAGLNRVMTGRAVFIHLGAMLGSIMLANVWQRIWPIERRRLTTTMPGESPSPVLFGDAALRLRHNAALTTPLGGQLRRFSRPERWRNHPRSCPVRPPLEARGA
jgi:uncharacterized membrane protein